MQRDEEGRVLSSIVPVIGLFHFPFSIPSENKNSLNNSSKITVTQWPHIVHCIYIVI